MIIAAALAGVIVLMAAALRRRQSLERVHAVLEAEQTLAAPHG